MGIAVLLAVVAIVQAEAEAEAVAETDPQFMGAPQPSGWGYHYQTHHPAYPASTAPLVTAPAAVEGEGAEATLPVLNPYAGYGVGYGAYPYGAGAWNGGYGGLGGYGGYGGLGGNRGYGGYAGLHTGYTGHGYGYGAYPYGAGAGYGAYPYGAGAWNYGLPLP